MFKIKTITSSEEFHSLKEIWNNLVNQSIDNNIFLTWEWLYNWWTVFGSNKSLFIVLLYFNKDLIMIAPFFKYFDNPYELSIVGSTNIGSDYLNVIIKKGFEEESLDFLFKYLFNNFYVINFTDISLKSYLIKYLKNNNYHYHLKQITVCPYIKLPTTFNDFLSSLSSNMRYNIRRKRKKYIHSYHGQYKLVHKTDDSQLINHFNNFIRLNIDRMNSKGIKSPFSDKSFVRFHQKIINSFSKNDWLQLSFLEINNEPIASLYNFQYNKRVYFYQSGFSKKWDKLSPGIILFSYSIENAIETGMEIFDFLKGNEKYKFLWTKSFTPIYNIKIFSKKTDYFKYSIKYQFIRGIRQALKKVTLKGGKNGK